MSSKIHAKELTEMTLRKWNVNNTAVDFEKILSKVSEKLLMMVLSRPWFVSQDKILLLCIRLYICVLTCAPN